MNECLLALTDGRTQTSNRASTHTYPNHQTNISLLVSFFFTFLLLTFLAYLYPITCYITVYMRTGGNSRCFPFLSLCSIPLLMLTAYIHHFFHSFPTFASSHTVCLFVVACPLFWSCFVFPPDFSLGRSISFHFVPFLHIRTHIASTQAKQFNLSLMRLESLK